MMIESMKSVNVGWVVVDHPGANALALAKVRVHAMAATDQRVLGCPTIPVGLPKVIAPGLPPIQQEECILPSWALMPKGAKTYQNPDMSGTVFVKMDDIVAWAWEGRDDAKTERQEGMH